MPDGGFWAVVGAAGTAVTWAIVQRIRTRLKSSKRVLPHVRYRGYFSIRTSEAPTELDVSDVEIVDSSATSSSDSDELDTNRPPPRGRDGRRRK